ncbi:MAG: single-stranded-DNA-specific exonuclease RecJ [bacterium]|nr:single-stranded-DNA-specific exonuclease RecJ [bacterium]
MNESLDELKVYPPLLERLLIKRGLKTAKEAEAFLNPDYEKHTHDPFLLKDMDKAVSRVKMAVENNEKIIIYSDYDTDGIPGAVILHDFFKKIGYNNFENYIPSRHNEGFGLHLQAIEKLANEGGKLLITVDCGIADLKEVEKANELGMDVIVTDHHEASPRGLPKAFAVLNPKQPGCGYPNKDICGAGVAFKLVQALCASLKDIKSPLKATFPGWEKWLLDMVGVATLSDMVPLTGENRALSYYGIKVLRKSPRIGLMRLCSSLRINQRQLTEDDIGFSIGPRINAASRMGVPMDAFSLLVAETEEEAQAHIDHLNEINDERKGTVAAMVKEMRLRLEKRVKEKEKMPVIVMGNPKWRPSLLGLACNKLMEDYGRPVFLWGRNGDETLKGSCRAPAGINVLEILGAAEDGTFTEYGGHRASGGFTVSDEAVYKLEEKLYSAADGLSISDKTAENSADSLPESSEAVSLEEITGEMFSVLERLSPFGMGNEKPVFKISDAYVRAVEFFGKEKQHLKIIFESEKGNRVSAISFFAPEDKRSICANLKMGDHLNISATLEKSFFGYREELRLRVVDILP